MYFPQGIPAIDVGLTAISTPVTLNCATVACIGIGVGEGVAIAACVGVLVGREEEGVELVDADALEFPHAAIASTMRQENKTTINLCFNIVVCITIGPFSKEVFVKGFLYIMRKRREKSLPIQSEVIHKCGTDYYELVH